MKKFLLTFLSVIAFCLYATAENRADLETMNGGKTNTSYSTRTSTNGWIATNAAIVSIDNTTAPAINGRTTAVGTITSPTLNGGIGTLNFKYANTYSESNGVSVVISIKQNNSVVSSQTFSNKSVTKGSIYEFTSDVFNVEGDFVIEIKNNSPSNSTSNKDRVSIWNLTWTSYSAGGSGGDAELAEPEISWTGESSYSVVLGEAFDAPTLTNPNDLTVTYESSNASVATIDSNGTVAIVGAGQTTISAEFAGDETYKASTVSYELNVITLGAIKANGSEATDLTVYANSEVVFSAENAESISYTVNGGAAVDASSWTPTEVGNYTVVVTATLASTTNTQTFNVTVEEAPATQTVTTNFSNQGYTNGLAITDVENPPVTFTFSQGSNSNNAPKYYTSGEAIRVYGGNTVKVSVADEYILTEVVITYGSSDGSNGITVDNGTFATETWTATDETSEVTFTIGGTSGNRRFQQMEVTYALKGSETPDTRVDVTLTFSETECSAVYGDTFTEPTLTVTPAEAASEVEYSSSNTDVATVDPTSGEVTIKAAGTATITAAIKDSETYKDVEVSYTLNVTVNVSSLTDFLVAKPETTTVISEPVTVYYQSPDKKYMFITDGTTNMMVYGTLSNTYQNGDVLTGIAGTYTEYGGMDELIPDASTFGEATEGTPIEPNAVTLAEEIAPCDFVILTGVDITEVNGNNATITDGTNSIDAYDRFGLSLAATENATIVAIGAVYNSNKQLYIVSVAETPDTREEVTLTFSETECSAVFGDAFIEPTLAVNPDTAAEDVKYSSSNTEVATVDPTSGQVTILAAGNTTITAAIKESETYKDVEVSYTLTVIELGAIMFNDFVLDEGHMCGAFVGTPVTISAANAEAMSYTIDEGDLVEVAGSSFTWTPEAVGEYSFSVSAYLGGQDKTVNFTVTVEEQTIEATLISDVLTLTCFGVSGTSYKEATYESEECGLTYTAQMAGGNESIQLRSNNSNSGIVVSANKYGLVAQAATIKWNSNTAATRTLSFYGQQTAFTAPTELYNTEAESLGEKNINDGAEQTIVFTEDFRYIGLRSKSGAQYVDEIEIIWTLPEPTVYIGEQNAPTIISQLPATLEFATTADEFVKVYYKFEEDGIAAVAAADGYTEVPAEGLTINSFGVLSYYAEVNGWTSNLSTIKFADTTGIVEIEGSEAGEAQWYDLNGRRVAAPGKGIYILKQGNKATKYAF